MNHTHEKWYLDLNEYIKQGEPDKAERSTAWKTAIGLQDVDGLKTSAYLLETAKEHIEGNINITDAQKRIQAYYEARSNRQNTEADTKESDYCVAGRKNISVFAGRMADYPPTSFYWRF